MQKKKRKTENLQSSNLSYLLVSNSKNKKPNSPVTTTRYKHHPKFFAIQNLNWILREPSKSSGKKSVSYSLGQHPLA